MPGATTKAALSAIRWNYLGFVTRSGSNFLIGVLLARLLGPKPFGQLATVTLVIGVANLLADAGFTMALVQAPTITTEQIRYVFSLQMLIALGLTGLVAASSALTAREFHDPGIQIVLLGLSPIFVLQALGQTSNALLRREFAFKAIQTAQVASYLFSYLCVGVPLAFIGAGVWSLVAAQLVQCAMYSILLYVRVRHSIVPVFHSSGALLLKFGAKVTTSNIANWGISNLDNVAVGHVFGPTSLGLYSRAFQLCSAPVDGVISTLQQVLFASCSRAEGRLVPIRRAYIACLSATAFLIFPMFWAMAACPLTVMIGLYGEQWRAAAVLFQPLAIAIAIHATMAISGPILGSLNLVEKEINGQFFTLAVAIALFTLSAKHSVLYLSWCVPIIYLFRFVVVTRPTVVALQMRWRDISRVISGPALAAVVTAAVVKLVDMVCTHAGLRPIHALVFLFLAGALTLGFILIAAGRYLLAKPVSDLLRIDTSKMPAPVRLMIGRIVPPTDRVGNAAETEIVIAVSKQSSAESDVSARAVSFHAYLLATGKHARIVSSQEAPSFLRHLVQVFARSAFISKRAEHYLLAWRLRQVLNHRTSWILYTESAAAALEANPLRQHNGQRVVLFLGDNTTWKPLPGESAKRSEREAAIRGVDRLILASEQLRRDIQAEFPGVLLPPVQILDGGDQLREASQLTLAAEGSISSPEPDARAWTSVLHRFLLDDDPTQEKTPENVVIDSGFPAV